MIRTVLGDIAPQDLGVTYMHEHLIIDSPIVKKEFEHIYLHSTDDAVAELDICKDAGVGAMVDCMPTGSGRDIKKLADISERSGIHIIAATGLHTSKYYDKFDPLELSDVDGLASIFVKEINEGCEGTFHKAGIIKVSTAGSVPTTRDLQLFEAAAIAHKATGAPILTHCEHGKGALQQLDILQELEVDLSSVVMSHTDKESDFGYHREILSSGVNVEYDQSLRQIDMDNSISALLTAEMLDQGFGNQMMLGTDGARRSLWTSLGGTPGLAALFKNWSENLRYVGVTNEQLELLFVTNPARFLNFKGGA
jgi:5-phospho-D-xylono-1,4-lactonase